MKYFFLFLIPLSIVFASPVNAQVEEEDESLSKDSVRIDKRRFIYDGKIYRENSPYLTIGYGLGLNLDQDSLEQNLAISYHHFIKGFGIGAGYHISRNGRRWEFFHQKVNNAFLSIGYRREGLKSNLAAFAGPSYSWGNFIKFDEIDEKNVYWPYRNVFGVVAELQYTYKILYDVGLGVSAIFSHNKYATIMGAQIHLFFSTAFVRSYD